MAPTDAEKKRARRARRSPACRDREKETSRTRMAVCRARNKARERASLLREVLGEGDRAALAARADGEKQRLICDWLRRNKLLRFSPQVRIEDRMLKSFMKKVDLHRIELQVAEFEIAMILAGIEDGEERDIASVLDKEKEMASPLTEREKRIVTVAQRELGNKWTEIAELLPGRSGTKIASWWHNQARGIEGPFTDEEKKIVTDGQRELGNKWTEIAERLPGRSGRQVRDHWYSRLCVGGVKQEDITKQGYSGTNGRGLSERNEDEILAAEAMAIMQYA